MSVHTEIYKDGFWMVGCMGDEMVTKGDKHGDGKFAYEEGAVYNTSIVMSPRVRGERGRRFGMSPHTVSVESRWPTILTLNAVVEKFAR